MAESKGNIETVNPASISVDGEDMEINPGAVQSVTTDVPDEADATSAPNKTAEDVNRGAVSTNDPEQPIAHSLVAGAGAPQPVPEGGIHPETHVASNAYVTAADKDNIDQEHIKATKSLANEPAKDK